MSHPININTDHAEKFGRPAAWVRRGWEKRKPTDIRRLELRRVRRRRKVEVARLVASGFAERGECTTGNWPCKTDGCQWRCHCGLVDYDGHDGYDDAWYYCYEGTPEDANAERSRFRVTIGDVA